MNLGVVRIMAAALTFAGLLVVTADAVGRRDQSPGSAGDREQITAILDRWEDAWSTHDMAAFASLLHEDGVWVLWTGEVWTGRRVIEEGHAAVHKTICRNSVQREHLEELTCVGTDAAVVRFCSVLTGSEQSPNEPIRSRKFLVVTKRQGEWKMSWGQNTRLRSDVPDSECFATLRKRGLHTTTAATASVAASIQGTWQLIETAVRLPGGAWETRPAPQGGCSCSRLATTVIFTFAARSHGPASRTQTSQRRPKWPLLMVSTVARWRDLGDAVGALRWRTSSRTRSGLTRRCGRWALTCASGFVAAVRMTETLNYTGEDYIT